MVKHPVTHILAGELRGRRIILPVGEHVRPSRKEVVEAGFNILGSRVHWPDVHFLDVCCGSGQWGLEALSRGAMQVTLLDAETTVAQENVAALDVADQVTVVTKGVQEAVSSSVSSPLNDRKASVVFVDPPYEGDMYEMILNQQDWGHTGTLWLVEAPAKTAPPAVAGLTLAKTYRYGKSALWLLEQR